MTLVQRLVIISAEKNANVVVNGEKPAENVDDGEEAEVDDVKKEEKKDEEIVYYDKAKSFFDNISCEATEREQG